MVAFVSGGGRFRPPGSFGAVAPVPAEEDIPPLVYVLLTGQMPPRAGRLGNAPDAPFGDARAPGGLGPSDAGPAADQHAPGPAGPAGTGPAEAMEAQRPGEAAALRAARAQGGVPGEFPAMPAGMFAGPVPAADLDASLADTGGKWGAPVSGGGFGARDGAAARMSRSRVGQPGEKTRPEATGKPDPDAEAESREQKLRKERERIRPFVLARPWGRNEKAYSAQEILDQYKPGKRAGDPFGSLAQAAKTALGKWDRKYREYLAIIVRFKTGQHKGRYTWAFLQRGFRTRDGDLRIHVIRGLKGAAPRGTEVVAWVHTHGRKSAGDKGLQDTYGRHSACDENISTATGVMGYLLRGGRLEPIPPGERMKKC